MSGMLPSGPNLTLKQALGWGSLMLAVTYVGLRILTKDDPNPLCDPEATPTRQTPPVHRSSPMLPVHRSAPMTEPKPGSSERGVYR
jgi:hypothetical protein